MTKQAPLAAIVEKSEADRVIAELKAEGCYDADRRISEAGDDSLAIPVTRDPTETTVRAIRQQSQPDWRIRDLDDLLRERGFSAEERKGVPASWSVLGSVIVGKFDDCPREREVGVALLDLYSNAETVLSIEEIAGAYREPSSRVIAGTGETETVHVEHGTSYAMDVSEVMFSPGNQAERVRMREVVRPDDQVFDMFAGIGYFTLPMARAGAEVVATEWNPTAFRYLRENLRLNEVTDRVDAYRRDCRALRPRVDRVVMGHYDAADYIEHALAALRPGGMVHLHDIAPADDRWSATVSTLAQAVGDRGLHIERRTTVKTHSPGMVHVVIDAEIGEPERS